MFPTRCDIRYFIGLVVLITSFWSIPATSYACSPAPPDSWFTERITVPSAKLPSGVGVRVITITAYRVTRDYVEITNSASTPLYIIGTPWTGNMVFAPLALALPPGVGPTHKVLGGQAFTWRPIFDTPQSYARMDWEQGTIQRFDAVLLSISHNALVSDEGNVLELAPHNQISDARSTNTQLPPAQTAQVPLVYGTQLLHVPITVSYILNPAYKSDSVASSANACNTNLFLVPILCFTGLVGSACVIGGWLVYQRWVKSRSPR